MEQVIKLNKNQFLAGMVTAGCLAQIIESQLPHPIPGIRVGLANVFTLITITQCGMFTGIGVAITRTIVSSLFIGTFLAPSFILSFTGATVSALFMGLFYLVLKKSSSVGLIGISVLGAIVHSLTQLGIAYIFLIRQPGLFWLTPILIVAAVLTGWFSGLVAQETVPRLSVELIDDPYIPNEMAAISRHLVTTKNHLLKIFLSLGIDILVLTSKNYILFGSIGLILLLITLKYRLNLSKQLIYIRNFSGFMTVSFLLHFVLTKGGEIYFSFGYLSLYQQGLNTGLIIAIRLLLLLYLSIILTQILSPAELVHTVKKILYPLWRIKLVPYWIIYSIGISLSLIPALLTQIQPELAAVKGNKRIVSQIVGITLFIINRVQSTINT